MYLKIKSANKELLSILNKNPNTDEGLYMLNHKKGVIVGNVLSENEYEASFIDTKGNSYRAPNEESGLNDYSFRLARVGAEILSELFPHLLKEKKVVSASKISWLDKTIEELDTEKCQIFFPKMSLPGTWFREGIHLFQKYFDKSELVIEPIIGDLYSVRIFKKSIVDCLNFAVFFCEINNLVYDKSYYLEEEKIDKIARVFSNIDKIPYFLYYIIIKRVFSRSEKYYAKHIPGIQQKLSEDLGLEVKFTPYDTHFDRILFTASHISKDSPVLNIGIEGFRYEKYFARKGFIRQPWVSYDIVDYSEDYNKFMKAAKLQNFSFITDLGDLPAEEKKYQVILSEVIEHMTPQELNELFDFLNQSEDIGKIIITTPNKNFNKYYFQEEDKVRREDHIKEYTPEEFGELMKTFVHPDRQVSVLPIGDMIGKEPVTLGCVITFNNK